MDYFPYTQVSNPRAVKQDPECENVVNCDVIFPHIGEQAIPFTAARIDPWARHSEEIFARIKDGEFGPIAPYEGEE